MVTKKISRTISINSSIGFRNWLKSTHNVWLRLKRSPKTHYINKLWKFKNSQVAKNILEHTGLIGIALKALALQYTIVSSPIISTPQRGGGTGINKPAPLSRLFWDHGPSTKSLSFSATSYVLTWRASLLSCHWWK